MRGSIAVAQAFPQLRFDGQNERRLLIEQRAAAACFLIRLLGLHFSINAPEPPGATRSYPDSPEQE
jgi:hypothetical protein